MIKQRSTVTSVNRAQMRRFEKGPEPQKWPEFTEFEAIPPTAAVHIMATGFKRNWQLMTASLVFAIITYVSLALLPWSLNILLDSDIENGISADLIPGLLAFGAFLIVSLIGAWAGFIGMFPLLRFSMGFSRAIIDKITGVREGGKQKVSSGEIVAAITSDTNKIGNYAAQIGNTVGGLVAAGVVVVLMLQISVSLGLVVAIGTPVIIAVMGALSGPLQKKLAAMREEKGKLTTLAADAVTGLRVMRGVGGEAQYNQRYVAQSEELREAGIRSSFLAALMGGLSTAVPAIFTAAVVGAGIWQYYGGALTIGQLVAFYGYTGYLSIPIWQAQFFFFSRADARVGSERIERVLALEPLTTDDSAVSGKAQAALAERGGDWSQVSLRDGLTGVELRAGELTAFVASDPDVSAALLERFGRTDDAHAVTLTAPATGGHGEAPVAELAEFPLAQVRENIVLSGALAELFQGNLLSNIQGKWDANPHERTVLEQMQDTGDGSGIAHRRYDPNPEAPAREAVDHVMEVADATDIVALGEGYAEHVAEKGRSLSGGQRQRISLARAVLTKAPILLLIEPTSAVDSHTELRIAKALRGERAGHTTGVVTTSPIMLGEADVVVLLGGDGRELARGTHHELLDDPRYYAIVHRAAGGDAAATEAPQEVSGE